MRLGLLFLIAAVACLVMAISMPLVNSDEVTLTYFEMADEREANFTGWIPGTGMHNSHVLKYTNLGLLGFLVLGFIGLLLVLDGTGRMGFLEALPWRPRTNYLAVMSMAMFVTLVGVIGMSMTWGIVTDAPTIEDDDGVTNFRAASPGSLFPLVLGMALIALVIIIITREVLYHADHTPLGSPSRTLTYMTIAILIVSTLALLSLSVTNVMTTENYSDIPAASTVVTIPFNIATVDYVAHLPDADMSIKSLDGSLDLVRWMFVMGVLASLVGCIGLTAVFRGALSKRTWIALLTSAIASVFGIFAVLGGIFAMSSLGDAGEAMSEILLDEIIGGYSVNMAFDLGIPLAIGLSIVVILAAVFHILGLIPLVRAARRLEAPDAVTEEQVEVVPEDGEALPPRVSFKEVTRRTDIIVIGLALLLVLGGSGVVAFREAERLGNIEPFGGIEDLEPWNATVVFENEYLNEYDYDYFPIVSQLVGRISEESTEVFMINTLSIWLTWEDEADVERPVATFENQPDMFEMRIYDYENLHNFDETQLNPQGGQGSIEYVWGSSDILMCFGNQSLMDLEAQEMVWDDYIYVEIMLHTCADSTHLIRPMEYPDEGNFFTLEISATGYYYKYEEGG